MGVFRSTSLSIGINSSKKDQFKYLVTLIASDGCNNTEIAMRIAQVKTSLQRMK